MLLLGSLLTLDKFIFPNSLIFGPVKASREIYGEVREEE
jgi:hypothetical protein